MLTLKKELNYHSEGLSHILVLKDGRLSSSSADNTLIIYNKESFQPDLIIKEHTNYVNYHIQLENENIKINEENKKFKKTNLKNEIPNIIHISQIYFIKCM